MRERTHLLEERPDGDAGLVGVLPLELVDLEHLELDAGAAVLVLVLAVELSLRAEEEVLQVKVDLRRTSAESEGEKGRG